MTKKQKKAGGTLTLREENTGKTKVDPTSMLKIEHLQKLATWASGEANIPPLGALFGRLLATNAEAEGQTLKTFLCERCESILQPGFNCTIRIEKNVKKTRQHKKSRVPSQNNVVYKCHFCSHPNIMRGTQKGYMKDLLRLRADVDIIPKKEISSSDKVAVETKKLDPNIEDPILESTCISPAVISVEESPVTPLLNLSLPSKKKRKIGSQDKPQSDGTSSAALNSGEGTGGSSKRKRKGWSSLKKIAESNEAERGRSISNFSIPMFLPNA